MYKKWQKKISSARETQYTEIAIWNINTKTTLFTEKIATTTQKKTKWHILTTHLAVFVKAPWQ